MGLLKHIRSRSRVKSQEELQQYPRPWRPSGTDPLTSLPKPVLARIFNYICPHTMDETYEVSEKSLIGEGCGLCDLRDLAHCSLVNRIWYLTVQDVLYRSIRIDAVHFCPLEETLSQHRRRKHIDPSTILPTRLRLFLRTARARPDIASSTLFLKLPYMARETHKADLARTVSALPNLRHVDLPSGFFAADPSTQILRDSLQSNCWDIRRMTYVSGAEAAFQSLAQRNLWTSLEVLELERLNVDLAVLRFVLASLPALQELRLGALPRLDDTAFQTTPNLPDFPALHKLHIADAADITSAGLVAYTTRASVRESLAHLALQNTGVTTPTLHLVLANTPNLTHLSVTETVSKSFPLDAPPPLSSHSLRTLNYEISSPDSFALGITGPAASHYAYLSQSLLSNALPRLRKLYVRDTYFAESLAPQLAPPNPSFAPSNRLSLNPFQDALNKKQEQTQYQPQSQSQTQIQEPLAIYAKGPSDAEWAFSTFASLSLSAHNHDNYTHLHPPNPLNGSNNKSRPASILTSSIPRDPSGPNWSGSARKSVMMPAGGGLAGFLAVPSGMSPGSHGAGGYSDSGTGGDEAFFPSRPVSNASSFASSAGGGQQGRKQSEGKGRISGFWRKGSQ